MFLLECEDAGGDEDDGGEGHEAEDDEHPELGDGEVVAPRLRPGEADAEVTVLLVAALEVIECAGHIEYRGGHKSGT